MFAANKSKRRSFIFFFLCWWAGWAMLQIVVLKHAGVITAHAVSDAMLSNALLASFGLLVISNMRYYLPGREKYLYTLIVSLALSGIWLLLVNIIEKNLFKEDALFIYLFNATMGIRFAFAFLMMACIILAALLRRIQARQLEDDQYKAETERMAKDAELNKLRQQLQPHFLFNSLNSISALTGTQPEQARHMIQQLSAFLRSTLRREDSGPIPISEELEQLSLYLDIEKLRFGYRLQTTLIAPPQVMPLKIPALLLQPLVENAIKFGLYDTIGEVEIRIVVEEKNNALVITVSNPFDETTAAPVQGTGFGLSSVRRRLFLLYGRQDLLTTNQENGYFTAIITIPQTT